MEDIWGRKVKGQNPPPSNHDHSYGPGVLTVTSPFGGASRHMPLNFNSESKHYLEILGWEATFNQNTAAILVLEAPDTIKHSDFVWCHMIIYDVSEACDRCTFDAR